MKTFFATEKGPSREGGGQADDPAGGPREERVSPPNGPHVG